MSAGLTERVLCFAPRGRDADLTATMLARHGIEVATCSSAEDLIERLHEGAGCAIVTSDVLDDGLQVAITDLLADQPPWSDFPIIVLTSGTGAVRDTAFDLGNMTILERPVGPRTLVAAVRAALRGRRRQYDACVAIQQRDQFLAMLAHELRNPLAAIVLAAEPVPQDPNAAQMRARRLALVARQANHLTRLVDDLLDVARVSTGKVELRREAVDIDATIRDCVEALEPRACERSIGFDVVTASGAIVEGDAGRIEQVIGNLVSNAIKYSPAGRTVTILSAMADGACEIRVRDQGVGITQHMLPRVFDLFAQADGSLDRSEGGLGIGLALVDRLVRLHGGSVTVRSDGAGAGSEFIVSLPIGAPPRKRAASPIVVECTERPVRVVIVDDNPDILELTSMLLRELGCDVETASDGVEGLERVLATQPDLALVDIGLPKLDGFAVAKHVRAQLASTVLVAVSGYGQRQDRERSLDAGFDQHLTKPVTASTLKALIQRVRIRTSSGEPRTTAPD